MRKRLFTLTLAFMMALALLPTAAFATEWTVTELVPADGRYTQFNRINFDSDFISYKLKNGLDNGFSSIDGVLNSDGVNILQFQKREDANVTVTDDQRMIFLRDGKYGVMDRNGQIVISPDYSGVYDVGPFFEVVKDGCIGLMDRQGKSIVPCIHSELERRFEIDDEWKLIQLHGGQFAPRNMLQQMIFFGGQYALYDFTGKELLPFGTHPTFAVGDGLITVENPASVGNETTCGYMDTTGAMVIPFQYAQASDFSDGFALVKVRSGFDWEWNVIDTAGKTVSSFSDRDYDLWKNLGEGRWFLSRRSEDGINLAVLVDREGNELAVFQGDGGQVPGIYPFSEGLARIDVGGKSGFIDTLGNEAISLKYDSVNDFSGGLARVYLNGKQGVIDRAGQEVVPATYENVKIHDKYIEAFPSKIECLCYSRDGEIMGDCVIYQDGLFEIERDGKWGLIDENGAEVLPFQYDAIRIDEDGLIAAEQGDQYHLLNRNGQEICSANYISQPDNGLRLVREGIDVNGALKYRYSMIDQAGKVVIPPESLPYDSISQLGNGLLLFIPNLRNYYAGILAIRRDGASTAYASTQTVLVDGSPVEFQCYALKDANGNDTNYIKLRDVASVLNGTAVQFNVGWDGAVNIETGKGYAPNGSEMNTPFSGNRAYENATAETRINGSRVTLDAIVLKDDNGGAYTYYKLRDLGAALGFRVDWSAETGIFIETK